ncbi:head GIN domain-containing protein [Mongoliitalea daihaiensis]|uniref:head GIN domain-containing protein n=1 Tax=Mongoliitalea daihaiensis TaxID=2782006 RepID=UPI001F1605D2|nr:head GIN domain-containing protein [Mongoliitalea daihaiensis]UJP66709.1 DUF2807 domain-containing protein [Mongoliitalea daihaiensis]
MKKSMILYFLAMILVGVSCEVKTSEKTYDWKMASKEFDVGDFKQVVMKGAFDMYLSQGDDASLEVSGAEGLVDLVEVSQEGDVLTIFLKRPKNEVKFGDDLKVSLTVHQLEKLEFEGAGQIKSTQQLALRDFTIVGNGVGNLELELDAAQVDAALNFVGKLELWGEAERLVLKNEGVGSIDASKLIVQDCEVQSSGIGSVAIHCTGELSLEMSGIGTVSYKGNPTVIREKVSGIGKVNRN